MERKLVLTSIVVILFTSLFCVAFRVERVQASGTIYIRADGSIDPPTANITTVDSVTYTFTDNNYDEIVVERSNVIIDGAGYTLQGNGYGAGFGLTGVSNVTLQNVSVKGFHFGIGIHSTSDATILGNNVTENGGGIVLFNSSGNTLMDNRLEQNSVGIRLDRSSDNTLRRNSIINNEANFFITTSSYLSDFINDVDITNTVDGKPIYYWINERDGTVPTDAGHVVLVNCTRIKVQNLSLTNDGVVLAFTTNSTVTKSSIVDNNYGVTLANSSHNIISENKITANSWGGVTLIYSPENAISGNEIINNGDGINICYSSNNVVSENNITNNGCGIRFLTRTGFPPSMYNLIYHNNFCQNSQQVCFFEPPSYTCAQWDDGYPSGGNYWSDYTDIDQYSGVYQNETGTDGIWDTPYTIDTNNQDNYPLMNPWTPTLHKFRVGDWVQTKTNLNVREGPGLNYTIISTNALGTIGQILGGPVEADDYVWWDVDYAVGNRGWSVENWLEPYPILNQPPTCVVKLQKEGVEIDEIEVWEFFDIYIGDSTGDKGIKQVRFSSDNVQDGYPTGRWTEWYDWYVSSEDWNATTKIKRWAFATPGYKEVWAEVKDEIDQTAVCLAKIFVPAPALPVITSPLVITPVKDIYNVEDSLEAEFTTKNIGDTAIILDVLTVGGRLNGFIPPEGAPDFTFQSVTLQPNEQYQYQGSLTLTQTGNYRFFVAYHIENPTPDEKKLLDENNWNTCVELGEGLTHTDRVKNIIVFEEDIVPDDVIQLGNLINRLKGLDTYIPPYLLDDKSFGGSVATLWMYWKSFFTDAWETYDMHYFSGLDYEYLRVKSLVLAGRSLDSGDFEGARKFVQMSIEFGELSLRSFNGAFEVYDRNVGQAEAIARFVKDRCQAIVVAGVTVWNPTAGKVLDYTFLITDYLINRELLGEEQATKILVRDAIVKSVFNEVPFFDGMTMSEYVKVNPSFRFTEMQNYIMNSEILPDMLYDAIKELIAEEAENLSTMISDMLSSGVDYVQEEWFSPVESRVYDSGGKITGVIGGEVRHEISRSMYCNGTVTIFFPSDIYRYEIAGIDEGTYGLEVTSVMAGNVTSFTATDTPTLPNATHQYTIDWNALSVGEEGVTVLVDSDGDGVVDRVFSSNNELTSEEFIEKTSPTYPTYALTVTVGGDGATFPPLGTYACSANSTIHVTALPDEGYALDYWELDSVNASSNNPYTVLMQENHTLNAVFRLGIYDITVTNVSLSKTVVGEGYNLNTNVIVANPGDFTEIFNITIYANAVAIEMMEIILTSGISTAITFTWNTSGLVKGNYTISVIAGPVSGETYTEDNTLIGGWVIVTIPGDVDGDREVDIFDIVRIATRYQMTYPNPSWDPNTDIIENGKIDIFDIVAACSHYGESW